MGTITDTSATSAQLYVFSILGIPDRFLLKPDGQPGRSVEVVGAAVPASA